MNAFLQWLASFHIPVEDIAREIAAVALVFVFALVCLWQFSPRWLYLPIALYAIALLLWWKLDQYPRG